MNSSRRDSKGGISWSLIEDLRCPCCGSRFAIQDELQTSREGLQEGILRCDCYRYPVVDGIAVLRQISPASSTDNVAVDRLKKGDFQGALRWLLENGSAAGVRGLPEPRPLADRRFRLIDRARSFLRRSKSLSAQEPIPLRAGLEIALRASRPRGYADYLYHRFANPSFLGAIPPLLIFGDHCGQKPSGRILDLMCGSGHASAIIGALCAGVEVVAADHDFVNLFVLRHLVAPQASPLCVDAELPLPFADSSVEGLFCLDGLHYSRSKVALLQEVDRIITPDGSWLFAHMHNANGTNENPGVPLSAEGYAKRFGFGQQRLVSESEIIREFQNDGSLDLSRQPSMESLSGSDALTLIGARNRSLWRRHSGLEDAFLRRPDLIAFNPLYRAEEDPDGVTLRSAWPSDWLRRECSEKTAVLPESLRVPAEVVEEIRGLKVGGPMPESVRPLLRAYVLVSLPECYPRPEFRPGSRTRRPSGAGEN